jgi:hypothetical protein
MKAHTFTPLSLVLLLSFGSFADDMLSVARFDDLFITELPPPGETYNGLVVLDTIPLPDYVEALTYDGDHWWVDYDNTIYCFDENGDYVSDFPVPNDHVNGIGWDGQYLWIVTGWQSVGDNVYQTDLNGDPGPYGSFRINSPDELSSITVKDDRLIIGTAWEFAEHSARIVVYSFDGEYLFTPWFIDSTGGGAGITGIGCNEDFVWAMTFCYYRDDPGWALYGFEYEESAEWPEYSRTTGAYVGPDALSVCYEESTENVNERSLGKIKAYFEGLPE